MAEVFRAKPLNAPNPDQYFAVKRILPHLAEDVEFVKMFVDEARLTVQLDHPNIVETYELGQFQSSHYIVMEFIAGKDLLAFQKYVRNEGTILNVNMALHIIREVAKGLDYAHNKTDENGNHLGIIHRDISPQNILVSWDGRIRIIDFGIAKAASQSTQTRAGVMKGKFGYMSPEQVQGQQFDHRADIFAMGTVLWELLTNRRLFKAGNQLEAMTMIGNPQVERPSSINPKVSAQVEAIVMKMLQTDPNDRYHWGSDLADDIGEYLKRQRPPFHPSQLTSWIRSAFRDDFNEERTKRKQFRDINNAEDVRRKFSERYGEGVEDEDQGRDDSTGMWDVDEAPDSDTDIANFVSQHTVVQAGGLDPEDLEEWDDVPDTIDETEEVVASRLDDATFERVPSAQVEVAAQSRYDAEPTRVTGSTDSPTASARPPASVSGSSPPPQPPQSRNRETTGPHRSQETSSRASPPQEATGATVSPPGLSSGAMTGMDTPPAGAARSPRAAAAETGTGQRPAPATTMTRLWPLGRNATIIVAALVGVVLAGVVAFAVLGGEESTPDIVAGDLDLNVRPVDTELEIYVNGRWVGREAPMAIEGLEAQNYTVEVDHPDYPAWQGEVTVFPDETAQMNVDLDGEGSLVVQWEDNPEQMQLFVDGEPVDIEGTDGEAQLELERGDYLVEAFAQGVRPIFQSARVEADSEQTLQLQWVAYDQLTLQGDSDQSVKLDGETRAEELPVILTELAPDRIYELEIGEHKAALGYPPIGGEQLEVDQLAEYDGTQADEYGKLVVETDTEGPWALVIDEVDTGLVVPSDEVETLPVLAGERSVGFQRGGERHEFDVKIIEEERTILRVELPE